MDRSGLDDKSAPFQGEAKGFAGRGLLGATPGHLHTGRPQEVQAIDKIGPVVALTNSAGGWRALLSALKAKGDHMRRIVAYETRASSSRRERGQSPSRARRSVPIPCRWPSS